MNVYLLLSNFGVGLGDLHLVGNSWYMNVGLHPGVLKNLRDNLDCALKGEQPQEVTMDQCDREGTSFRCSYPEYKKGIWTGNWVTLTCNLEEHSATFRVDDDQTEGCELRYHTTANEEKLRDLVEVLDANAEYYGGYEKYAEEYEKLVEEAKKSRRKQLQNELLYFDMDKLVPTYNMVDCLSYEDLERVEQNNKRRYQSHKSYFVNGEAQDGKGLYQIPCVQQKKDADTFIRPKDEELQITLYADRGEYTMTWWVGGDSRLGKLAISETEDCSPEEREKLYKKEREEGFKVKFTVAKDTLGALAGYLRNPEEGKDAYSKSGDWVWSVGWHPEEGKGHVCLSERFPDFTYGRFDGRQHLSVGFDEGFKTRLLEAIEYVLEVDTSLERESYLNPLYAEKLFRNSDGEEHEIFFCMEHNVGWADTYGNKEQYYAS